MEVCLFNTNSTDHTIIILFTAPKAVADFSTKSCKDFELVETIAHFLMSNQRTN